MYAAVLRHRGPSQVQAENGTASAGKSARRQSRRRIEAEQDGDEEPRARNSQHGNRIIGAISET